MPTGAVALPRGFVLTASGALACLGVLVFVPGCVIVPTFGYKSDNLPTRQNVSAADSKRIVPSVTTREEVLLRLGEPDASFEKGARFVYLWADVGAVLVAGAGYSGGAMELSSGHAIEIAFGPDGVVSDCRVNQPGLGEIVTFQTRRIGGVLYAPDRER
jgi:hypothetical protein